MCEEEIEKALDFCAKKARLATDERMILVDAPFSEPSPRVFTSPMSIVNTFLRRASSSAIGVSPWRASWKGFRKAACSSSDLPRER